MNKYRRITRYDRYQIQQYLAAGKTKKWISLKLGFHRSSIYREVRRGTVIKNVPTNLTAKGEYSAYKAQAESQQQYYQKHHNIDRTRYKIKGWVEDQIRIKIIEGWSPEQIAYRLRIEKRISLSTEAIYKYILSCKKRGDELHKYLRLYRKRKRRFKRHNRYWELQYQRRKSIENRPVEANKRLNEGHWERDLMEGRRKSGAILTAVDRKTKFTLLQRVRNKFANEVNIKTAEMIRKSKLNCLTITNDNGHEFGEFWNLETSLNVPIYFTHPLCPWERGTVENTIGLLRQFIPKGTDLNQITDEEIRELQDEINSRPRKSLGFKTPKEVVTGKEQRLIKRKRLEPLPPEYYEQFYLTPEEIEEKKIFRGETVALSG